MCDNRYNYIYVCICGIFVCALVHVVFCVLCGSAGFG